MARIFPSDISRLALSLGDKHSGELETLRLLKEHLPDAYSVYHGIHWAREFEKWTVYGEVDFVVVNKAGRVLFIEQKNGKLLETDEGLVKEYANERKNVHAQIGRSVERVREKFGDQHKGRPGLDVDYLNYLPEHRVQDFSAPSLDESRIVDASAKDGLVARIEKIFSQGLDPEDGHPQRVHTFFRQTMELTPDIHAYKSAHERTFVHLSGGLVDLVDNLEMEPFRLRISATAGSGKSLLAVRYFERKLAEGRRPLLVCYNRRLSEQLKRAVGEGGYVNTVYGFFTAFLKTRGQTPGFDQMNTDPDFWSKVQDRILVEEIPEEWQFDTLIIDEGQDLEEESFEVLKLFLRESSDILRLEDPEQNLRDTADSSANGYVRYRSRTNFRTPQKIATYIRDTLDIDCRFANHLPGVGVDVHEYDNPREQPILVGKIVRDLMERGFEHEDIVLLTCNGLSSSVFNEVDVVNNIPLCKFTGEYDADGNQVFTDGRVTFDTVRRFKGQQAPAVVLVDVDPDPEHWDREHALLFCAMTRATVKLDLVVNRNNPRSRRFS